MQENKSHKLSPHRIENLFLLNGILVLLGWNVILVALDYFQYVLKDFNVYLYFPIPYFVACALVPLAFNWLSKNFKYKMLVLVGIIAMTIFEAIMFCTAIFFSSNQLLAFIICMILSFCVGISSYTIQLSFSGMMNYFGGVAVSRFMIGTAVGACILIVVRMIIVGVMGSDDSAKLPIIIYICITVLFNGFCFYINSSFFTFHTKLMLCKLYFRKEDR